ncbi:MAG TPA: tyrosine-type recombinase/integrase [Methyloceanibacter sp.]|nr:tyrosine-type recombinase/integrase [Methyloceanibacter sp.]
MAAYAAALAGERLSVAPRAESGSASATILAYLASDSFKKIKSPETKRVHRGTLERFATKHGKLPFKLLDKEGVRRVLAPLGPGAARTMRNVLRRMMKWAVMEKLIVADPTEGIKATMPKTDGFHTMTDAEREQYRAYHPIGTKARAAFEIFFYTALRCSDARRLGPQHIVGGELKLAQQKTGEFVEQPVHARMLEAIAAANMTAVGNVAPLAFLLTNQGQPYTAKGLSNAIRDWCRQAGLPHCSAHTIRKGTLTMLADKSRTVHEIAAYGGHQSLRMVETYTKKANQQKLARAAATAFESEEGTKVSTMPDAGDKKEKNAC